VADAVGAPEPHGVFEVTVDGFGVVSAREEPLEVGVTGSEVLRAVASARSCFVSV